MPMNFSIKLAAAAAVTLILAGCASNGHQAPVDDRSRHGGAPGAASSGVGWAAQPPKLLPGAENAGKPGYYTVKPGDTLIRISLDAGQNWRDVAAWNNLGNANVIEVGQVLRVVPPGLDAGAATGVAAARPVGAPKIESRPLESKPGVAIPMPPASAAKPGATAPSGAVASSGTPSTPSSPAAASAAEARENEEPAWAWPASGPTIGNFEEGRRKGLAIGGKAGDPVFAAGDGRVVYAGSGLRGYGNLVIIKHNGDFLTAYAHNQTLLVKEDQIVRKGQKIAEMGATDADRVQLHFEIRKQGKPIDPARQLPPR